MNSERALLIRKTDLCRISGLSMSLVNKIFMRFEAHSRPDNLPEPPPHLRFGNSVYIIADCIPLWLDAMRTNANKRYMRSSYNPAT